MRDISDAQQFSNETMGGAGAVPECVPYYDHGHVEADAGWAFAAWQVPTLYASYFDDAAFEAAYYSSTMRWYMEHWAALAQAHGELLELRAEFVPGADSEIHFAVRGISIGYNAGKQEFKKNDDPDHPDRDDHGRAAAMLLEGCRVFYHAD